MNKRLYRAKQLMDEGAYLAVVNSGGELVYSERGIKTLLSLQRGSLSGAFVADKIVGKAAAAILARGGALQVYAGVISSPALEMLKTNKVITLYGKLVPNIQNAEGTGICPMEEAILGCSDPDEAYEILYKKVFG